MSPLEVLQLIGYSTAAALHLWVGALLLKRSYILGKLERVLMVLALAVGAWHLCNLVLALHSMLGFEVERWKTFLRLTNSLAVIGITLSYSLLLHAHLYLWANSKNRALSMTERVRVYLSYLPTVFLTIAVWKLWREPYGPMYEKLGFLLFPFALWAVYCLCLVAVTDYLIARSTSSASERRLLKTLAASFIGIAALIFAVYILRAGQGTTLGLYLQTIANLGSLVPTALLAYHIYRYRYLELIIKESLIVATVAAVVLVAYLYGIRTLGAWMTERFSLREGVVESILILTLALFAAPLRNWLDRRFRLLFEREAALYRDIVTSIGENAGQYRQLPELLRFFEERVEKGLGLRRVRIIPHDPEKSTESDKAGELLARDSGETLDVESRASQSEAPNNGGILKDDEIVSADVRVRRKDWAGVDRIVQEGNGDENLKELGEKLLKLSAGQGLDTFEGVVALREQGFELAFPLRRDEKSVGLMLVDAAPDALTHDVLSVLEIIAGQVAIAIEDFRLVSENVQLERMLAQRERLAALGQMAATVAHEIKNPLSAIKSIVQVMREDERIRREYERDLELIVGETNRLSRSVSQMLNFARNAPPPEAPGGLGELLRSVTELLQAEADARAVNIRTDATPSDVQLDGATLSAVRDALSNLLLNAIQATPRNGVVRVSAEARGATLVLTVKDEGPGVNPSVREKIWEPFFTTKQRGTGLGLAIVRKRIEEIGGTARLAEGREGLGATFVLIVPLRPEKRGASD